LPENRRAYRTFSFIDYEMFLVWFPTMAAAIAGVAFHASDGVPCDCWGEDTQWVALPFIVVAHRPGTQPHIHLATLVRHQKSEGTCLL
jgi:hypothetical protein